MHTRKFLISIIYLLLPTFSVAEDTKAKNALQAEAILVESSGEINLIIRNVSTQNFRIHMRSIEENDMISPFIGRRFFSDPNKHEFSDDDYINEQPIDRREYKVAGQESNPNTSNHDRVVELKPGEFIGKTYLIWDLPLWKKLLDGLKHHDKYMIFPKPAIYSVNEKDEPVLTDVLFVGDKNSIGFQIDRDLAKKLQALEVKIKKEKEAEMKNLKEKPVL